MFLHERFNFLFSKTMNFVYNIEGCLIIPGEVYDFTNNMIFHGTASIFIKCGSNSRLQTMFQFMIYIIYSYFQVVHSLQNFLETIF